METQQTLEDLLTNDVTYERASVGKRFANYLIDIIVFYIIFFVLGVFLALAMPSILESMPEENPGFNLLDRLLTLLFYAIYMSVVEVIFKGKSIGKFITKTKAVNLDGTPISSKTAFARGFSRAVPFCAFSAFGSPSNPWQDRWTDTAVIEDRG